MGGKIALLGNFIVRSCSLAPAGVRRILLIFGPEHNRGAANNRANFSKFHLRFGQKEKKRKESGILSDELKNSLFSLIKLWMGCDSSLDWISDGYV